MSQPITKDITFFELMRNYPTSIEVLRKHNLGCVGCMGARNESLEQGCRAHGLDVNELLKDLNQLLAG